MADLSKVMEREMLHSEHAAQCFLEAKRRDTKKLEHKPSQDCWCQPEVDHVDPETGCAVYVHRGQQ